MKFWKSILLSTSAFLALATTVTYTSCEKDACTELICRNGGSCSEGFCRCKTGFEGTECELKVTDRFIGTYIGYSRCNADPLLVDTVDVYVHAEPNLVTLHRRSDQSDFRGTATGNSVVIDDFVNGTFRRQMAVVLDVKELDVVIEDYLDGQRKNICEFVGKKK
jgi:hypothetical protein